MKTIFLNSTSYDAKGEQTEAVAVITYDNGTMTVIDEKGKKPFNASQCVLAEEASDDLISRIKLVRPKGSFNRTNDDGTKSLIEFDEKRVVQIETMSYIYNVEGGKLVKYVKKDGKLVKVNETETTVINITQKEIERNLFRRLSLSLEREQREHTETRIESYKSVVCSLLYRWKHNLNYARQGLNTQNISDRLLNIGRISDLEIAIIHAEEFINTSNHILKEELSSGVFPIMNESFTKSSLEAWYNKRKYSTTK